MRGVLKSPYEGVCTLGYEESVLLVYHKGLLSNMLQ